MTHYVVMADQGEYDDRTSWPVEAFDDAMEAEKFVGKANEFDQRVSEWMEEEINEVDRKDEENGTDSPYPTVSDALEILGLELVDSRYEYTNTSYSFQPVPFVAEGAG